MEYEVRLETPEIYFYQIHIFPPIRSHRNSLWTLAFFCIFVCPVFFTPFLVCGGGEGGRWRGLTIFGPKEMSVERLSTLFQENVEFDKMFYEKGACIPSKRTTTKNTLGITIH